jgi:uncharacterized membrane protein
MNKTRVICVITSLLLSLAIIGVPLSQVAMATDIEPENLTSTLLKQASLPGDEEEVVEEVFFETFEIGAKYPVLTGASDTSFLFEVDFTRAGGDQDLNFDLIVTGPKDWLVYAAQDAYNKDKRISAMRINRFSIKETIVVIAVAPYWLYPEPGDYSILLEASSEDVKGSIDLTAKITARYDFVATTGLTGGRLNINAKTGNESYLPINITNIGTATLDSVTLSSSRPEGWSITYTPEKIENLSPGASQEVEVSIMPPKKTISGDYIISLQFAGEPSSYSPDLGIRVTVETSTSWGFVAIGIILAIGAALLLVFKRLGRR